MADEIASQRVGDADTRERSERHKFLVNAPMRAASGLQKRLPIDELGYRHIVGYGHGDARAYFLYGALDEVLKATISGMRWIDLVSDEQDPDSEPQTAPTPEGKKQDNAHADRLVLESVIDEQEMWIRKLAEILFDSVLFETTNEQDFYRLYLIGKQIDAYVGLQADFDEFFACRSANADSTIRRLLEEAEELRNRLDSSRVWFLVDGVDFRRPPPPGRIFRSARQRFMRAHAVARPDVRLTLGVSYETGYATPSRSVHPNLGGPTKDFTSAEVERNISRVGLLGLHIVVLAHRLAGIEAEGEAKQLTRALETSDGPDALRRVYQRELEVGDIVFAYGDDLCQVVETAKSKYGNTSYKVRYLVRPLLEGIEEDWFPSEYIRLLYRRRDIKPAMLDALRSAGATGEETTTLERLDDAGAAKVLAETFTKLEQDGNLRLLLKAPKEEKG